MKHKTWFRLVLKAIGVLLIVQSLPGVTHCVMFVVRAVIEYSKGNAQPYGFWDGPLSYYLGMTVQLASGLYLFFGGAWLVNKAIPSNRAYCPECGYQIATTAGENCPECGVALPRESSIDAA